jgi:phosphate transport system permease protein
VTGARAAALDPRRDAPGVPPVLARRALNLKEAAIRGALFLCAAVSIVTTVAIVGVLAFESVPFFREVPLLEFLGGTRWAPLLEPRSFGVLPLVTGTLMIVVGSGLIAVPVGLATAIFLSEYAGERLRNIVKPVLEILAGIPTVVYGYFALTAVTPVLQAIFPATGIFNAASAAIVVGIMILPMVASLCEDALSAVPDSLRQGGFAVGATRDEVALHVVLPSALSGVMASFVLALSRAIGETMAVTLAAGATPRMTANPFESIQTMTAYIVQVSLGDTPADTLEHYTIFAVGALLFLMTLGMNVLARRIVLRFRVVGE